MLSVADRLAIAELSAKYAQHVDRREFAALGSVFAGDAELVMPEPPDELGPVRPVIGRDNIIESMQHLNDIPVTLHAVTGTVLTPGRTPDLADGCITGEAHHVTIRDGEHRDLVWYLHYDDTYRREDGQWLIARRALQIDWIETRPVRRSRAATERG